MPITNIGTIDVQYVCTHFTTKAEALTADRRSDGKPNLTLILDDDNKYINFIVSSINVEKMRSKKVKHGMDLYLLKNSVVDLFGLLSTQFNKIAGSTPLDSTKRETKDPRPTYDNAGLEIPITEFGNRIKLQNISAVYSTSGYTLEINRNSDRDVEPSMNIEIENKSYWDAPRLHIGIRNEWAEKIDHASSINEINIKINWSEFGQLFGCLNYLKNKM